MQHYLGIDLGGTKTEVAVLNADSEMLFRHRLPTPANTYPAILETIATLVQQARQFVGLATSTPVGLGIPGCVDARTGLVRGANTQVLNGKPFLKDLETHLKCGVRVENDANCLALSEAVDGAARGSALAFAVIAGTGCGGGLAIHQKVWSGRNALAGEWGHNPLPWPSQDELAVPRCWCGQTGCLESWLSGPAVAADHCRVTGEHCTAPQLVERAGQGDVAAFNTLSRLKDRLARALAQAVNLLDPDVIVLGGGISQIDLLYDGLTELISRHTFSRAVDTPVRPALHGDSSGVRGAAWLWRS